MPHLGTDNVINTNFSCVNALQFVNTNQIVKDRLFEVHKGYHKIIKIAPVGPESNFFGESILFNFLSFFG